MRLYEAMRRASPDFFIHSGDQIYADGPIQAEVKLADGTLWKNITTPEKSKVAETLAEYRGNFAYNLLDDHKRRFCAEVPFLVQWDDHETRNNWYPGQMLGDERYRQRSASLLAAYARRAMFEYNAMRIDPADPERIYRSLAYGPSLDVFMLDERSYRGPNSPNRQTELGDEAAFLGSEQLRWLKRALLASRGDLEGDRERYAHQPGGARPQPRRAEGDVRGVGQRRQRHPVRTGARAGEPVVVHQEQCDQERGVGDGRRALCAGDLLQSVGRASSRTSCHSGSSWRAPSTPGPSVRTSST